MSQTPKLKYCSVTDYIKWRSAVRPLLLCNLTAGRPGAAFKQRAEREILRGNAELVPHRRRDAVEQRDRQRAPFDDHFGPDRVRTLGLRRVAQCDHAAIDEQAAIAVLGQA